MLGNVVSYMDHGSGHRATGLVVKAYTSRVDKKKIGSVVVRTSGVKKGGPDPFTMSERTWERTLLFLQGRQREILVEDIKTVTLGPPEAYVVHQAEDYFDWLETKNA